MELTITSHIYFNEFLKGGCESELWKAKRFGVSLSMVTKKMPFTGSMFMYVHAIHKLINKNYVVCKFFYIKFKKL